SAGTALPPTGLPSRWPAPVPASADRPLPATRPAQRERRAAPPALPVPVPGAGGPGSATAAAVRHCRGGPAAVRSGPLRASHRRAARHPVAHARWAGPAPRQYPHRPSTPAAAAAGRPGTPRRSWLPLRFGAGWNGGWESWAAHDRHRITVWAYSLFTD